MLFESNRRLLFDTHIAFAVPRDELPDERLSCFENAVRREEPDPIDGIDESIHSNDFIDILQMLS